MTVSVREKTTQMAPQQKQEVTGAESTRSGRMFVPPMDIFETSDAITILADMPGVRADGLTIDLRESILTIEGRVDRVEHADERLLMSEYEIGSFRREFKLTNLIDQNKIDAALRDGVLRLTLPKAEAARPRKIQVRSA